MLWPVTLFVWWRHPSGMRDPGWQGRPRFQDCGMGLWCCSLRAPAGCHAGHVERTRVAIFSRADSSERPRGRCGLAVGVVTPADNGPVGLQTACMSGPSADQSELSRWWLGLAISVITPARDGGVSGHRTPVVATSCANGNKGTYRWSCFAVVGVTPACDCSVGPHAARGIVAGADSGKGTERRRCFAGGVVTPTGKRAISPHPACEVIACADRGEAPRWRGGLAVCVVAGARNGAVRPQATSVFCPHAEGHKWIWKWRGFIVLVVPPA